MTNAGCRVLYAHGLRTNRARSKIALAVRACTAEDFRGAGFTERALKRADARVGTIWRQIAITAFAVWLE